MGAEALPKSLLSTRTNKTRQRPAKVSTRTGTRKRRRPPPAKTTKPRRRPHVAVLGNPRILASLRKELTDLGIATSTKRSPAELIEDANDATRAVVIAPPVPDASVAEICASLKVESPDTPVFTVARAKLPRKSEKLLYEAGSMAVFLWPREKRALLQTLIGLVHVPRRVMNKKPGDVTLAKTVRARIKAAAELEDCRLSVRVIRGVVVLTGTVRGLWQAEAAAAIARRTPGVQDVVSGAIEVRAERPSDRTIEATIRRLLRSVSELDLSTLALKVSGGHVVLAGTAGSALELERACALIRQLRGVTSLRTFVTVSASARLRDRALVKQIEKAIAIRYPKQRIGVSAFGKVAVLRGTVPLAETRENVGALVAMQPGVERVVNKLEVGRKVKGRREP